ncbi:MAG: EAL domain-containing protein [Sphaerochaetaceae bacterium]|nr:EAL domain-containing protein [Sphaerochaetaceae bacterium]
MLFISVSILALASGILVLQSNHTTISNRIFFALVTAISIWSSGLAFANLAPNREAVELWRRISALGWGSVYAIFLHFIILISSKRIGRRPWWFYALLYTPALLTILAFSIPLGLNAEPYQLRHTEFGWVNIAEHNIWDIIFYIYYGSYTILGLVLLALWGKKSKNADIKKQARLIIFTILTLLFAATFTDIILSSMVDDIPQMAPVLMLLPVTIIYNTIRKGQEKKENPLRLGFSYIHIIISVVFYVCISFIQISLEPGAVAIGQLQLTESTFRGILTQVQMFISIYLVLRESKPGFIISILMNTTNLLSSLVFWIRMDSGVPIPGIISYVGVLILLLIIRTFRKQSAMYIERIQSQRQDLKESERQLYKLAYYDSLTGLPSRDYFIEKLQQSLEQADKHHKRVGIIFIDFDSFKAINDTAGHMVGDLVLQLISQRLTKRIGKKGTLARFGGDEFLVEIPDLDTDEPIHAMIESIMETLKKPAVIDDEEYHVSASIGIAVYPDDGESPDTLIKNADIAMYEAKGRGKNQAVFCTDDIKDSTTMNHTLVNNLYWALDRDELHLLYQPKISLETNKIIGFEALLRWNNSEYGVVNPEVFIPMAEQTGMIRPIGLWVMRTACQQIQQFNEWAGRELSISINISLIQLRDPSMVEHMAAILEETHTPPHYVEIEITESIAFQDEPFIMEQLRKMKELGISIAIDDFGTGYSSFSRLRTFPIDLIKIDIEFVRAISSNLHKDQAIIRSIIQLAKNLGLKVLAEGVETEEQFQLLKEQGCDFIQGFLFYTPLPVSSIKQMLDTSKEN